MDAETAVAKTRQRIEEIAALRRKPRFCPEFKKWHREATVLLKHIFGDDAYQVADFTSMEWVYQGIHVLGDEAPYEQTYRSTLEDAAAILTSIADEIVEYGLEDAGTSSGNPAAHVAQLLTRFHSVARQLRVRHGKRETLDVRDEYDVQDLLHSLLRIHFDDIRVEEWTPSYANGSSRMDFLLKQQNIVIETKMTRKDLAEREIVDQLIVDVARYKEHPNCKTLICFVYDPDGWIGNSAGITSDLEKASKAGLQLKVFIYPEMR